MIKKILDNIFITKKYTQHKTLHTLKTDVFKLPNNKNIGKLFSKYVLFPLNQAYSSDSSQILILQYPIPGASLPSLPSLSNFPWRNKTSLQHKPHHVFFPFPCFFLPHSTICHHYWIYQTICQFKPIKLISKLHTNHNTLFAKHTAY